MKKLIPFLLLLLWVVSCKETPEKEHTFQEPPHRTVVAANTPDETKIEPGTAPGQQFNPERTNAMTIIPAEKAPPVVPVATNPPIVSVAPPSVAESNAMEQVIPAGQINFPAVDLNKVLDIYAELVGRTLLRPANLGTPQITLVTQTPLTKREAIQAFDAVFALNGISIINVGDKFAKVVPAMQALQEAGPRNSLSATNLPELGQFLTEVVQLKYVKPSEMVPAIQPFGKLNSILPIDGSQILIIRDYTENVKRMLEMIAQVDITVPSEFISEVIPIKYAKAGEIADILNSLGAGGGGGGGGGGAAAASRPAAGQTRSATSGAFNRTGASGMGSLGGMNSPYGNQPGVIGQQPGGAIGQPGQSFTDRLNNLIRKASASGDLQLFGQMKMIADDRSNSLLVFATRPDMDMIKSVIAKMDVVLAQVLIETLILDVQIGKGWNYQLTARQPKTEIKDGTNAVGSVAGLMNNSGNPLQTLLGMLSGSEASSNSFPISSGLSYFGRWNGNLDVVFQAVANDSRVNVVQRPQILTTHATPGSIFIGSTVPYITGSTYGGYGGYGNSYQQLQVGIGLNVTPYINQDGLVVMQIDEQIDEISGSINIANVGDVPTTTSRKLSAEVAVKDGETIILGGFIRNSDSKSSSGVPILMDIPLLGELFKSKSDTKARNELLVMMRPTVLRTPEIAAQATTNLKNSMPGVLKAESEVRSDEKKALEQSRREAAERAKKEAAEHPTHESDLGIMPQ
jgi:general secretion pathway protein D